MHPSVIAILLICFLSFRTAAQPIQKTDSLIVRWSDQPDDQTWRQLTALVREAGANRDSTTLQHVSGYTRQIETLRPYLYNAYGLWYVRSGRLDTAKTLLQRALKEAREVPNFVHFCELYGDLGYVYEKIDQYDSALLFQKNAIQHCKGRDRSLLARTYHNLGLAFYRSNRGDSALNYFIKALEVREEIGDRLYIGHSLNNIGALLNKLGRNEASIPYQRQNFQLRRQLQDTAGMVKALNSIAVSHHELFRHDSARYYYQKSLRLARKTQDQRAIGIALNNMGNLEEEQENDQQARIYLEESLQVRRQLGRHYSTALTMGNLANVLVKLGDYKRAEKLLRESESMLRKLEAPYDLPFVYDTFTRLYEREGNYRKATPYYRKYINLQDSLHEAETREKVMEIETRYQTEKKEQAIILQRQKIKTLNAKRKLEQQRRNMALALAFTVLILGGIAYQRQRIVSRTRQQLTAAQLRQAEQELSFKEKELQNYTERLLDKSRTIKSLQEELATAEMNVQDGEDIFEQLTNHRILTPQDWEIYKVLFERVYPGFFKQLARKYPKLTEGEIRILALEKLDLTTKETSEILGVAPGTVKVSRNRIRRKLELEQGEDLKTIVP